ncbi:MAG: lipopolysaccharide heptosyltransferase I [Halioglobus sp.]|nr:lipopolysaccharide heptosyltransferase I [Halioglobus sp.]
MRVLVVKLSSCGDVLHTLPALSDALAARPDIACDWVVEEAFAEIPAWHPAVHRVIPVALRRWRRQPLRALRGPQWRRARRALAARAYDAVIDAQGLLKSALIARLAHGPRYGMDRRSAREGVAALAYQQRMPVPRELHAIDRLRLLFARALGYAAPQGAPDYGLDGRLPAWRPPPGTPPPGASLLFLHGSAQPRKLWPEAHWAELARLACDAGYRVWLPFGDSAEQRRAARLATRPGVEVLPATDLRGLAARMRAAAGAVAVDTGPGHLAAALGLPCVSLYGPTRPQLCGTRGSHQAQLCAAPGAALSALSPRQVWSALQAQLAGAG